MNKQFRLLALDAGYSDYMTYGQDGVLERFAESIVRDCAKISLECGINLNREDIRQGIARNIKEHFGVQE